MKATRPLFPRYGDARCLQCQALIVAPWAFAGRGEIVVWHHTDQPGAGNEPRIPWKERRQVVYRAKAS
jgi:hypothetical protein